MGFKRFDPEDFVVSADTVTSTVWSGFQPSLNTYATSSVQKEGTSGPYYLSVYQTASNANGSETQFCIAFGDETGRGSVDFDSGVPGVSPSKTIYGQYRTLVLEDENSNFVYGSSFTGSHFYAVSVERARYKEKLFPGSMNLVISSSNTQLSALHLTDDSNMVNLPTYYGTQRAYQVISGSDGIAYNSGSGGLGYTTSEGSYGLFLPDIGTILLNGKALDGVGADGGIELLTGRNQDTQDNNPAKLFIAMKGAGTDGNGFLLNSEETLSSDFIFVRARNSEFNYSENPSYISGSTGAVIFDSFIDDPTTYITSVGLYNDNNELLAVAKLSRPLPKDFTKELLVRVKLDF